jgi:hypothetical protein
MRKLYRMRSKPLMRFLATFYKCIPVIKFQNNLFTLFISIPYTFKRNRREKNSIFIHRNLDRFNTHNIVIIIFHFVTFT